MLFQEIFWSLVTFITSLPPYIYMYIFLWVKAGLLLESGLLRLLQLGNKRGRVGMGGGGWGGGTVTNMRVRGARVNVSLLTKFSFPLSIPLTPCSSYTLYPLHIPPSIPNCVYSPH
jgi:hypothetical protein